MNQNLGQQSATSFTQPIKMPLSQTVLKKGVGQSTPLSAVGQVPWSGMQDLGTPSETISDFGANVQSSPPPALAPGSRGEQIANDIVGQATGITQKGVEPLAFLSLATPPSLMKGVFALAKPAYEEFVKPWVDQLVQGIFGKQPSLFQQDIGRELTMDPITGLPLGEIPAYEAPPDEGGGVSGEAPAPSAGTIGPDYGGY